MEGLDSLIETLEKTDEVQSARRMEYGGGDLTTVVIFIREPNYDHFTQPKIAEVLDTFSASDADWHMADVLLEDGWWVIEAAPIHAGNLPQDITVRITVNDDG